MRQWQLQTAKARLSELVRASSESGPQEITLRGQAVAVVLGRTDFDRLSARKGSFVEFLRRSPLAGAGLEVVRGAGRGRRVRP